MKKARLSYLTFALLVMVSMLLASCQAAATTAPTEPVAAETEAVEPTTPPAEPTAVVEPTAAPTEAPTAAPAVEMGTEANPIVMAIAPSATTDELIANGDAIAKLLSDETGLVIKAVVPTNYKAMIEAMASGNAQIGWLAPFGYLVAHETMVTDAAGAEVPAADVAFISLRNGADHYATQFIGQASQFTAGTDISALQQFADKKPCWTDPFSASGYVIPASLLAQEGVKTKTAAFVQGHPTVVRAVYAGGICDFGATYVDARTNSAIVEDMPDVNDKVIVVYQTEPIIPNDTISYAYDLPQELRDKITAGFEAIAATEEGAAAMKGLYEIDGIKPVDDTFFDEFRVLLAASGIDIASLVK
ncbi:MAG TPA: phosphate/phosphite/phosphonate ABC transporter substrate-binding protein [Anaerolineaceae bacterium]|nr:phosphate/phosphite/phosphonate ABC transporter substrate-binding protein [Anaerolineaceae bacterium]